MSKKVFISCSINSSNRIKNLINRLKEDNVEVVCNPIGFRNDPASYVEQNINDSSYNNILIICDSNYKDAIDNKSEPIISHELYKKLNQSIKSKILLIVYDSNSIPDFLASENRIDFSTFEAGYRGLLFTIFHEELIMSQSNTKTELSALHIFEYKGYFDIDVDKSSIVVIGEKNGDTKSKGTNTANTANTVTEAKEAEEAEEAEGVTDTKGAEGAKEAKCTNKIRLKLIFSNITNNKITSVNVESTDQIVSDLKDTTWPVDKKLSQDDVAKIKNNLSTGIILTQHEMCSYDYLELRRSGKSFTCNMQFNNYGQHFCMICLKVTNKTIYGLETVQLFTIITIGKTIFPAHIESIS